MSEEESTTTPTKEGVVKEAEKALREDRARPSPTTEFGSGDTIRQSDERFLKERDNNKK